MSKVTKSFEYGGRTVTIETGEIARQASATVMVNVDDTVVMVAATGKQSSDEVRDFFPLTVNYMEKFYAAGRIPGSFFKREGRPSEGETLTSRLMDRPIRPLFPKGFRNDVQVVATVISSNPEVDSEIVAMIGSSAALAISGMPFNGPVGTARVGYIDGEYKLNPSTSELENSDLDLVVAGTKDAVLMVESEANGLSEEVMLGAVIFGHDEMQTVITAINELKEEVNKEPWDWTAPEENEALTKAVFDFCETDLTAAFKITEKLERLDTVSAIKKAMKAELLTEETGYNEGDLEGAFEKCEKKVVRGSILEGNPRIDGRDNKTVRPISVRTGVLPRTHGSALFTRGETQALVVTTLGTEREAQKIDALNGEKKDHFLFHYNFPPYCVGETGMVGSPKRREIGHGRLAKRGVLAAMPSVEDFPYTIRCVSEITESNGSSSMASVCGSSLSMMDAGVPLKAPVAGVAMGLIKEGDDFAVLTDILGDEDHLGDMDFKVAGTADGINALQMDIKIDGITREIMEIALNQAKDARLHILEEMGKVISEPSSELSDYAPRYVTMKINPEKIREVIGKGGETIRSITEKTSATVDLDDKGNIKIAAVNAADAHAAKTMIEEITADVEVNKIYNGKVARIMDFGAFVTILPGKDGLLHISQISKERVEKVTDYLNEGDDVRVKVTEIDRQGRMRLSVTAIEEGE